MNTCVLLPLQESMAIRGAGIHDQWQGYMSILVVNPRIMKSISILTEDIRPMIQLDIDTPGNYSPQKVDWTLAIH